VGAGVKKHQAPVASADKKAGFSIIRFTLTLIFLYLLYSLLKKCHMPAYIKTYIRNLCRPKEKKEDE
jgi:hypothetical protein